MAQLRLVLPFWYRLTLVVLEKGPLKARMCVIIIIIYYLLTPATALQLLSNNNKSILAAEFLPSLVQRTESVGRSKRQYEFRRLPGLQQNSGLVEPFGGDAARFAAQLVDVAHRLLDVSVLETVGGVVEQREDRQFRHVVGVDGRRGAEHEQRLDARQSVPRHRPVRLVDHRDATRDAAHPAEPIAQGVRRVDAAVERPPRHRRQSDVDYRVLAARVADGAQLGTDRRRPASSRRRRRTVFDDRQ